VRYRQVLLEEAIADTLGQEWRVRLRMPGPSGCPEI
jgi:hypothetical protein